MRYRLFFNLAFVATLLAFTTQSRAEDLGEAYGPGVLMSLTADGSQFGFEYLQPKFEIEATVDGSSWNYKQSSGAASEDMGVTGRVGYRMDIGHGNSVSVGLHYHQNLFGKNAGDEQKEIRFGEYVGFKRYWTGSNVYLLAFLLPVSYQSERTNHADGTSDVAAQFRFFQEGGFGIGYIF